MLKKFQLDFSNHYVLLLNEEVIEDSSKLMQSLVGYHKSSNLERAKPFGMAQDFNQLFITTV